MEVWASDDDDCWEGLVWFEGLGIAKGERWASFTVREEKAASRSSPPLDAAQNFM